MIVLTRKLGERIILGADGLDQVTVVVLEIDRYRVRLGIEAARHIPVMRAELVEPRDGTGREGAKS